MDRTELERRTKTFALRTIELVERLPKKKSADILGYQLLKSGTSVGANYREANRAESRDDFIHKIAIVEKEASESEYWLELLKETALGNADDNERLLIECRELLAIFTAIGKTAKVRRPLKSTPQTAIRNPIFKIQNSPPNQSNDYLEQFPIRVAKFDILLHLISNSQSEIRNLLRVVGKHFARTIRNPKSALGYRLKVVPLSHSRHC